MEGIKLPDGARLAPICRNSARADGFRQWHGLDALQQQRISQPPGGSMLTIAITLLSTPAVVVLALNLHTPEKEIRHQIE